MASIHPAVKAAAEIAGHSVRVALEAESGIERLDRIPLIKRNRRYRVSNHAVLVRIQANWNIQVIGERFDLARFSAGVKVGDNLDRIPPLLRLGRQRIFLTA